MRGVTRIKRILRNTRRLASPVAAILIYHRIIELPEDRHNLAVFPDNFASHLEYIQEKYSPMSLSDLAECLQIHDLPHRAVVITFDDGYADNFLKAWPLLEMYQVPATIFTVSGAVNSRREFWWDELERIFYFIENLPEQLSLCIQEQGLSWPLSNMKQRQAAFKDIHQRLRLLPVVEREKVLKDLANWAGTTQNGRSENLPMKYSELCQIAQSKFIEIGAHTKTHPVLSTQSPEDQYEEIVESRLELEKILDKQVRTFSYPYGNPEDFTQQTVEIVKSAGFSAAVTTIQGGVEPGDDRYQLKRCEVNNWNVDLFKRKLDSFFYK